MRALKMPEFKPPPLKGDAVDFILFGLALFGAGFLTAVYTYIP